MACRRSVKVINSLLGGRDWRVEMYMLGVMDRSLLIEIYILGVIDRLLLSEIHIWDVVHRSLLMDIYIFMISFHGSALPNRDPYFHDFMTTSCPSSTKQEYLAQNLLIWNFIDRLCCYQRFTLHCNSQRLLISNFIDRLLLIEIHIFMIS